MSFRSALLKEWGPYGSLAEVQVAQLERHYEMLVHWNRTLNLTRIADVDEVVRRHYCESLYLGRSLPEGELRVADVGSGAGFPGIPMAVLRPELCVTLIESHRRKAVFLREAAAGIPNVVVLDHRASEVSSRFDWVVSRAVSAEEVLSLPLGPHTRLLTTTGEISKVRPPGQVTSLPWGTDRILATFHVEHERNKLNAF